MKNRFRKIKIIETEKKAKPFCFNRSKLEIKIQVLLRNKLMNKTKKLKLFRTKIVN